MKCSEITKFNEVFTICFSLIYFGVSLCAFLYIYLISVVFLEIKVC